MADRLGVAVMAYGTPASPAAVEEYYTHIRRGNAPTPEQLADLTRRYDAIGGTSPLAERTEAQRVAIQAALDERAAGRCTVVLGQKHATPFIEDAVATLADSRVDTIVGLVLAPHFSGFSVGQYQERLAEAARAHGVRSTSIDSWHLESTYVAFLTAAVQDARGQLPERTKVLFTAHSLPERVLVGDPYPDQLQASARVVAEAAGLDRWAGWSLCWQSAGRTPEPWRGPDILEVIRDLAATGRAEGVLVCPQGFVSDHLEVVYDLDIEAREVAEGVGLAFGRTRVLNADPTVMGALADRILAAAVVTDVVVVGGGFTGLVAACDASRAGASVTIVEPHELGGKVRSSAFDGAVLDEGADAFLARVPEGVELCRDLGLAGDLVSPSERRARVWSRGALRRLPEAQLLGVPTDLAELAECQILSPEGERRVEQDLATLLAIPPGDVTIGSVMRDRLGDEALERLIDPLVGGINAGDTDQLSLAATVPQLDAALRSGRASLIEACRVQRSAVADPAAPVFFAPAAGMGAIVAALVVDLEERGVVRVSDRVVGLEADGGHWHVALERGRGLFADGAVVALPATPAAELLRPHAARAATLLAAIPYASVAMISLAVRRDSVDRELDASGFLVPRVEGRTVTACSWTSAKWPHLAGDGTVWLRAALVGRDGDAGALALPDDALVAAVVEDLADLMALRGAPVETRVTRWDRSFPQYRPGHLDRVATIDRDLAAATPTLVVAGAALRGLGVPACIRQGADAARRVLAVHPDLWTKTLE